MTQPEIITDAALVNQFAEQLMKEPEAEIITRAPSESEVLLPGGFIKDDHVVTTAEVRELTGADEEAIAKAGSIGKALNTLLQRGLVKLGMDDVKSTDLDTLLAGDRDAILLGIRRVTFGNTIPLDITCPSCRADQKVEIDLTADVPLSKLQDPVSDRRWEVKTKLGMVKVALPNGLVQKKLMEAIDSTSAEVNTILLSGCIVSIDGSPSIGTGVALSLGMNDRSKIIEQIIDRNPGPRLGEVKKVCKACGEDIELPLSLADLFRL